MEVPNEPRKSLNNFSDKKLEKLWAKYIHALRKHLTKAFLYSKDGKLFLPLKQMQLDMGQYQHKGKRGCVYHLMMEHYPLFGVVSKGNNLIGKISEIMILPRCQNDMDALLATAEPDDILTIAFPGLSQSEIAALPNVPIDLDSLSNFIQSTKSQLENPDIPDKKSEKMREYLRYVEKIVRISLALKESGAFTYNGNEHFQFPYVAKISPFGREYHKGTNLQSAPKVVRHAALGECYNYDLNSAVITFKLHMVQRIYHKHTESFEGVFPCTTEYVANKKSIRHRLAALLGPEKYNIDLIKQLITAVSFGAPISDGAWRLSDGNLQFSSFSKIVRSPEKRKRLKNDGWIIAFAKEQSEITKLIIADLEASSPEALPSHLPAMKDKRGNWKPSKLMAFIYQQYEAHLMLMIKDEFGDAILLTVHDGFYASQKLSADKLNDILWTFSRSLGHNPYMDTELRFSFEKHEAYQINLFDHVAYEHKKFRKTEWLQMKRKHLKYAA